MEMSRKVQEVGQRDEEDKEKTPDEEKQNEEEIKEQNARNEKDEIRHEIFYESLKKIIKRKHPVTSRSPHTHAHTHIKQDSFSLIIQHFYLPAYFRDVFARLK